MRRLLRRLGGTAAVLLLLAVVVLLSLAGGPAQAQGGDGSGPAPGSPGPHPPIGGPGGTGRQLYLYSCATCHGQNGEGSQRGPSLVGVGAATVDFYLRTGRMPLPWESVTSEALRGTPKFDDAQISALDSYVASLGTGGQPIPGVGPGELGSGRDLYLQYCAACHAPSGIGYTQTGGRIAPDVLHDGATQVAEATRIGPTTMPRFPESVLDQEQLNDVVSYVLALQEPTIQSKGGAPIGEIGAAVEGPLAFGVTALLLVVVRLLGKRAAGRRP